MRNEVVEEVPLIGRAKVRYNGAPRGGAVAKQADEGAKETKSEQKSGTARKRSHAMPLGAACLSEKRESAERRSHPTRSPGRESGQSLLEGRTGGS
jgi:hypothetical protein